MALSKYGYYSNWGSLDDAVRFKEHPPAMGGHIEPEASDPPAGIAYPNGWVEDEDIDGRPPIQTFRLTIGQSEMPERYMLLGRRFVPESEWPGGPVSGDGTENWNKIVIRRVFPRLRGRTENVLPRFPPELNA